MALSFLNRGTYKIAYCHYKRDPYAPVIVFLPGYRSGMGGTKSLYLQKVAAEKKWSFISLDYYGHGQSEGSVEKGNLSLWIEDVLAVLKHCNHKKYTLVGSSMGGWIMLHIALRCPQLIKSLMGIAAAPDFIKSLMENLPEALKTDYKTKGEFLYPTPLNPQGWFITRDFIEDGLKNCLLSSPLNINLPVYLLHGYKDPIVPWTTSKILMEQLASPDTHLHLLKEGEHQLNGEKDLSLIADCIDHLLAKP